MTLSPFLALLLLQAAPAPAHAAGPEHFFVGRTEGVGTVNIIMSGRHAVRDRSRGRIARDGALILDQVLEEAGKPPRSRAWRLVRAPGNRITGTISDARGPVTGEVRGNVLHLRYRSVEGPGVEQWITLRPGGRTAANRMVFRRFGVTVATVETVIRRVE
jgi:hypothetical protein